MVLPLNSDQNCTQNSATVCRGLRGVGPGVSRGCGGHVDMSGVPFDRPVAKALAASLYSYAYVK